MIFKQYHEVFFDEKTMTQRLHNPVHAEPGKTQAAVPKRGRPAHWIGLLHSTPVHVDQPVEYVAACIGGDILLAGQANRWLADHGFVQLRVLVAEKIHVPIQTMTEDDARAEGVQSLAEYAALWNSINPKTPFESNPEVWRIRFRRTDEFVAMFNRWRAAGGIFQQDGNR